MRIGALVPALTLAAALGAPSTLPAEPDHRSRDRGRRSGYDRPSPGHRDSYRSGRRSYKKGSHRSYTRGYRHGHHRYARRSRRPYYTYRPYPRSYYRPYSRYRPVRPPYYPPYPVSYGYPLAPPPYRGGVHGGISIGVPGFGLSLVF